MTDTTFPRTNAADAAAALAALILLADWLFYDHSLGLSLALFALALGTAAIWRAPGAKAGPLTLLTLGALPVVEHLQPLSLSILIVTTLIAIAWSRGAPGAFLRPLLWMPVAAPRDALRVLAATRSGLVLPGPRGLLAGWSLPVGGALILAALLVEANPVLDGWLTRLTILPDPSRLIPRGAFWTGLALMIWPLLIGVPVGRARPSRAYALPGVNAASVARALVVFNTLLAVQSATDATLLWAGAALPDGMTWAEYAHRGAYPLLATALLAIAFSLVARPHLNGSAPLRALLVLWLVQNLALTASSGLRLSAYIDAYG